MFNRHLIIKSDNNEEVMYLFINNSFEFSKDFSHKNEKTKKENLINHIKNYIKLRNIKFNGKKVFLVVSGIVIGTIVLGGIKPNKFDIEVTPKTQYMVSLDKLNEINIPIKSNTEIILPTKNKETKVEENQKDNNIIQPKTNTTTPKENISIPTPQPTTNISEEQVIEEPQYIDPLEEQVIEEPQYIDPINVHLVDGTIQTMSFEDFIVGVVAAEMPASFNIEALKAQSVATRTYYLKARSQGKTVTQVNHGQITYRTENELKQIWGANFDTYYSKTKNAVYSTKGEYITYNGSYIEAVYCSTNNGRTESSLDVWGNYYPYLISVESSWDMNASSYLRETDKSLEVINSILGINIDENTQIQVLSRTDNDSIKEIMIGDKIFTGLYLRSVLGLRSTDFDLTINGANMHITTRGYGHGVGMSQYGANGMANAGYTYRQILNHYYPETFIEK